MSDENAISIIDFEVEWKASNFIWLAKKAKKTKTKSKRQILVNEEYDVDFIIDTLGDPKLRNEMMRNDNFVTFEAINSDEDVQGHLGGGGRHFSDTITQFMAWM